jgi:Asp-tRNA(Asn)/Glu-tRNA(Gln) amidotransferase A subunit family amidase
LATNDELVKADATTVVEWLRRGDVTPHEALDALDARIAEVDDKVNALPTRCFDTTQGSPIYADRVPQRSDLLVVAEELPVGLQIVAPPRREAALLAAGKMLEDMLGLESCVPISPRP